MNVGINGVTVPGRGWCKRIPGTLVTDIIVIAGKGTGVPLRDAPFYVARYGGMFYNWQKKRGNMLVDGGGGVSLRVEVHWVQEASSFDCFYIKCKRELK